MKIAAKSMFVIADDLTGANDTGVQFARQGLHTEVMLDGTPLNSSTEAAVVVVDTNSRTLVPKDAYHKVKKAASQAYAAGFRHYYKKVDSTLRGNVGIELNAILDLGLHDFAFVMPAFPQNGRTTIGGHHLLKGMPLAATEIARDPKCPVRETVLPELLRQQTGLLVGHIGITELLQGEKSMADSIRRHVGAGCTVISCDAWLDEHFQLAVRAARSVSQRILWSGSAGLADCMPQLLGWTEEANFGHPVLVVAGSVSSVTRGQIDTLLADGFELVEVEAANYLTGQDQEVLRFADKALDFLANGKSVVLSSGYRSDAVQRAKEAGIKLGMSGVEVSDAVARILGLMGSEIIRRQEVAGVVLTGGDTAVAVCQELGVTGIRVMEEVAPGIPLGEMITAQGKRLRVVTKAGAFGDSDALSKAVHRLQQKEVNQ